MKKNKVSIRDVASLAGTSIGSASRVINGAENVTPEIKKKVLDAIEQLHYQPNHAAQTLRSKSTKTVGCLFTDVSNPLYAKAFKALEARFIKAGYMLLLANGLNDPNREISIIKTFQARSMDGVILAPTNEKNPDLLAVIKDLPMPIVVYDRDLEVDSDAVLYDHKHGIKLAINYLIDLGHTNIALVLWNAESRAIRLRVEAYEESFVERNIESPHLVIKASSAISSAYNDVMSVLSQKDRPTAFIAQGTQTLSSTLRAIAKSGLEIPGDISVIAIGDSEFAENHLPPLTALRSPIDSISQCACDMILNKIKNKEKLLGIENTHKIFQYSLITRESCAKLIN